MKKISKRAGKHLRKAGMAMDLWRGGRAIRKAGFWFVDIPRTSSSSIKAELGARYGSAFAKSNLIDLRHSRRQLIPDHVPAVRMQEMLGHDAWSKLYRFTFVRNPFDRVHSLYHYVSKTGTIPENWGFPDFVECILTPQPKMKPKRLRHPLFAMTMEQFLCDRDDAVLVDDIFRFEERGEGIQQIADRIGFRDLGQLHIQSATPNERHYRTSYDAETRDKVAAYYARDLERFDYDF